MFENYGSDTILADARPVYVPLEPGQPLDLDRLAAAFTARTRAIVVNTPSNPAGRVLTRPELEAIARLCQQHDALAVTDEIYEHIRYQGEHLPIATLPGMRERTGGRSLVRFVFCKTEDVLAEASRRLAGIGDPQEGSAGRSVSAVRSGLQQ